MDCTVLLTRQLVAITSLAALPDLRRHGEAGARAFRELCDRAVLHVLSREQILWPAWRRLDWKDLPADAMATHVTFKSELAELMVASPGRAHATAPLGSFLGAVRRQIEADRKRLVPAMRKAMDLALRRMLCNDIELLFDGATLHAAAPPPSVRELVDEAAVVLSSLAGRLHWPGPSGDPQAG